MLRWWLFAAGAMALLGGQVLAAEGTPAPGAKPGDKPAEVRPAPDGKLPVTRAEVTIVIARAMAGGDEKVPAPPPWPSYKDVPEFHWAYRYVEYAKSMGVTVGDAEGNFGPDETVDRGQMAGYLARALVAPRGDAGLVAYLPPLIPTFSDVTGPCAARVYIEYLADPARKIVQGSADKMFHPEQACTKDEMAALVARAFPPKPAVSPKSRVSPAPAGATGN